MDELPQEFWLAVEQFNQHQFYACHDMLEALWIEAMEPDKTFYQGILQIAVGLYHLGNQNWRGAVILMGEGINRLRNYQPSYEEIDTELLLKQTSQILKTLQEAGPEQVLSVVQRLNYSSGSEQPSGNQTEQLHGEQLADGTIAFPVLQKFPLNAEFIYRNFLRQFVVKTINIE